VATHCLGVGGVWTLGGSSARATILLDWHAGRFGFVEKLGGEGGLGAEGKKQSTKGDVEGGK
jgi:hypothetical protein